MCHVTCEMWHMTRDTWHRGWWTLCQNFRSLALTIWKIWWLEDISTKEHLMSEWMSHGGVCRTAPATPGLLNTSLDNPDISSPACTMAGAGWETQALGGVCSCWSQARSNTAAEEDRTRIKKYAASITAASKKFCIPEAIIMAVISRESRGGAALGKYGILNWPGSAGAPHNFVVQEIRQQKCTLFPCWREMVYPKVNKCFDSFLLVMLKGFPGWNFFCSKLVIKVKRIYVLQNVFSIVHGFFVCKFLSS